jgi:hypothetical protein
MIDDAELEGYAREALPQFQLDELEGGLDTGLIARVEEHLRLSLRRVNEVPGDDSFWSRTNRRPTLSKAQDWFRQRLDRDPDDHEARWVVISYTLAWCQYGAEELVRPLIREDIRNVRWLVGASEWLTATSGPDRTDALRAALRSSTDEASLQGLASTGTAPERRAARIALAVLDGSPLARAIANAAS